MTYDYMERKPVFISIVLACSLLFSLFTVYVQATALGLKYLEGRQLDRHHAVLEATAGNPWQYRVLPEVLVEGALRATSSLHFPRSTALAFVAVRVFQNALIFLLAAFFYRKLGLSTYVLLIGLSLLAWSMTHSLYDSDLQFNTYFDIVFYLAAGLLVLYEKDVWIIPLTGLAALNRETCGLIPFMLVAARCQLRPKFSVPRKALLTTGIALAIYGVIFAALRFHYGPQKLLVPYGHQPGLDLLWFNAGRYVTWVQLFAMMGLLPILALLSVRRWPRILQMFALAIIPAWFLVHLFFSTAQWAESRYFLVPQALIFIPGVLFGIVNSRNEHSSSD